MKKILILFFALTIVSCEKECRIYNCVDNKGNEEKVNIINIEYYEDYDCVCEEYFN
jgi:thiol-disulfide isomerase/thioredoxin